MEIAFATKKDEAYVRSMWKYCFHDSENYMDAFFSHVFKQENTIIAYENNVPIGSVQMYPHTLVINGVEHKAIYIGGLCVLPSYRGKGVAKKLMTYAEDYMKKTKVSISFLVPFSFEYYRRLGYECMSFLSELSGSIEDLKPYILSDCTMHPSSLPPVEIYHKFSNHFSLFARRNVSSYESEIFPLCKDAYCYSLDNNGGYILYTISGDVFNVLEIVYEDEFALKNILGFIYAHRAELKSFRIRTSADGYLRRLLCENSITESRFPHAMCKTFSEVTIPDTMQNYINMLGWI